MKSSNMVPVYGGRVYVFENLHLFLAKLDQNDLSKELIMSRLISIFRIFWLNCT